MRKFLVCLVAMFAIGCGGDDSEDVSADCATYCGKSGDCDSATPDEIATCVSDCERDLESADSDCRSALAELTDCFEMTSCSELNDPDDASCVNEIFVFLGQCESFGSSAASTPDEVPSASSQTRP